MKYLLSVIVLAILVFGGYNWYMGQSEDYYVQITNEGTKTTQTDGSETYINYEYELPGYNEAGKEKKLKFMGFQERPLKMNHYLKVSQFIHKTGVKTYEEVAENEIPNEALKQLQTGRK
ncbi:YxeA family protein [Brochothrix campestris]|uniref:YxeA family protein n=1 Tax=Brochothrix campestris TaxID=2757 RepID=UPI0038CF3411